MRTKKLPEVLADRSSGRMTPEQESHEQELQFVPEMQLRGWPLQVPLELKNSLYRAWVVDGWYG
jgi:hypothetical protein